MFLIILSLQLVSMNFQTTEAEAYVIDDLMDSVFSNYTHIIRPRCHTNETTTVGLFMSLRQLIDINEPQQQIQLNSWINMVWTDCRLRWNPFDYNNISDVIVPYNLLWLPDITLYDNIETVLSGYKDYRAHVKNDGEVKYNFQTLIVSVCAIDVQYFPFDLQKCVLTLGSWAYNGWEVNITKQNDKIGLEYYVENSEWALLDAYIGRRNDIYDGVPYPTVEFHIQLKRKPLFYMLNVVFPCLLITFVAVLGFLLPPMSGEKVSLQVTVLLSLAVFQLVVLDMIPASGDPLPFISCYFIFSMLIVALSCLLTVIVLRVHFKGKYGVILNERIRKYILIPLAKITFIDLQKYSLQLPKEDTKNKHGIPTIGSERHMSRETSQENFDGQLDKNHNVREYLESILYHVGRINEHMELNKHQTEMERWWNVFSNAFNRLFLSIYILSTVGVALILSVPSLIQQN